MSISGRIKMLVFMLFSAMQLQNVLSSRFHMTQISRGSKKSVFVRTDSGRQAKMHLSSYKVIGCLIKRLIHVYNSAYSPLNLIHFYNTYITSIIYIVVLFGYEMQNISG